MSTLRQVHNNPLRLFGIDEATGFTKIRTKAGFKGASKHVSDIAEHPARYQLNAQQKAYVEQVHRVEDWVKDGLKEAGIDVKELSFDEFSHWVHREVIGKNVDDALLKIGRGVGGKIGKKASFEKTRFYETAAEGVKAGILYEPSLERVTELYIQSAAKRISDQRIAGMVSQFGEKPLERAARIAPQTLREARETAFRLAGARHLVKVINRAARGEKLTEATLKAQERRFPELGKRLREVVTGDDFAQASERLALAQRDLPEKAMLKVQHSQISQEYGFMAEHIGDITHRMAEDVKFFKGNFNSVREKVNKTLPHLENLERTISQQIKNNLPHLGGKYGSEAEALAQLKRFGAAYAAEHRKLVVSNDAQRLARDAAVAIGEFRFDDAVKNLRILDDILDKGKGAWDKFALTKSGFGGSIKQLAKVTPKAPVTPEVTLPTGWRTEVGKITVKPGMEEVITGKAMVDWQRKTIIVSDARYLRNPKIMNEEIAHIRLEELSGVIKQAAIKDFEVAAKYKPIEIRSQFARREGFGQEYGQYLTNPSSVSPEVVSVFKKYFPSPKVAIPKAAVVVPRESIKALAKEANQIIEASRAPFGRARVARKALLEQARTPTLGTEATIMHPAFQGKIYPKNVSDEIHKYWDDVGFGPLNKLATLSGEMRTLVAAADFSAMFIQGLPGIALHPKAWEKAAASSFKAFLKPQEYQSYMVKNLDNLMERANFGGYVGGFEFMEAMPALQKTAAQATRLALRSPAIGRQAIQQTYGRFEASFGAFGDVMRNEMWKGLKQGAKSETDLMEIARHIDRMTGVMSSKGLGLGKTQRDFEQAFLFFAPRYTRAGFALVGDMMKGGYTGEQARKALGSMMAAGAVMYAGIAKAVGQEPNFDPTNGRFMTIEITDPVTGTTRHFGVGGMMTSMMRFAADVTASATGQGLNEPLDFVKLNRFDNPFLKFMFSKSAPLTGFTEGMMFGHNYFGEPFENPGDYASFMLEQVMPIALQSAFMEKEGFSPTAIAAEELGMRTFPRSDWEKRNIIRDQLAQATYGMDWQQAGLQFGELAQLQLERGSAELQAATEQAAETTSKIARGEGLVWDMWRKEGKAVEDRYRQSITTASAEFATIGDGTTFREKADEASAVRRAMYAQREQNPEYAEINQYFNQPVDTSRMNPQDVARREYYQIMYSPDMYDQFGNYRFDEADRREQQFVQRYGRGMLDYVEEYMGAKWDEPPALQALKSARDVLQPYWDIEKQIWSQLPQELKQISDQIKILERTDPRQAKQMLFSYPQIVLARRQIAILKKQMKATNQEISNALSMFYRF